MNEEMEKFFIAALQTRNLKEQAKFFRDILTDDELRMIGQRWHIAEELWKTYDSYKKVAERVETSTATVNKVSINLRFGEGGLELVLKKLFPKMPDEDEWERREIEKEERARKKRGHLYAKRGL